MSWVYERYIVNDEVENGRWRFVLFGITLFKTPSIFLGNVDDSNTDSGHD